MFPGPGFTTKFRIKIKSSRPCVSSRTEVDCTTHSLTIASCTNPLPQLGGQSCSLGIATSDVLFQIKKCHLCHRRPTSFYKNCLALVGEKNKVHDQQKKEIVEKNPSSQAFVMLGDAYMSIQEPDKAIELYESALKKNPKDHALSSKIGRALVKSHNYAKAVSYYEAALKTGHMNFLRYELADLTLKLGNFDKCEKILKQGLENIPKTNPDLENASNEVKFKILLSKLYFETGNWEGAINFLLQAKENQNKILKRGPSELSEKLLQMKTLAAEICCQLGQFYENHRDLQKSINFYQEALIELSQDIKIMLSVARLHLLMGDLEHCYQMCQKVLILDKDNDMATLMLADLMYQRSQTDDALLHFQQLLDRNPNQYHALARAIELAWRCGDLPRAEKYLEQASESSTRSHLDAGFNYCKADDKILFLHRFRYTGDPNSALQHFNRARRDLEWGERSIYNMIEICLNPDNEIIGGEVFDSADPADTTTK
uniref:Uncharacterized protein n=1 Tax=Romanomermis culicivorax TaxID=13658 RepID=A0A915HU30_ROMCU